jgi:hypothetical protein
MYVYFSDKTLVFILFRQKDIHDSFERSEFDLNIFFKVQWTMCDKGWAAIWTNEIRTLLIKLILYV